MDKSTSVIVVGQIGEARRRRPSITVVLSVLNDGGCGGIVEKSGSGTAVGSGGHVVLGIG